MLGVKYRSDETMLMLILTNICLYKRYDSCASSSVEAEKAIHSHNTRMQLSIHLIVDRKFMHADVTFEITCVLTSHSQLHLAVQYAQVTENCLSKMWHIAVQASGVRQ